MYCAEIIARHDCTYQEEIDIKTEQCATTGKCLTRTWKITARNVVHGSVLTGNGSKEHLYGYTQSIQSVSIARDKIDNLSPVIRTRLCLF